MGYSTSGITNLHFYEADGSLRITALSSHTDKVVQCYVGGELVARQTAPGAYVEFHLAVVDGWAPIFLLAVDTDEADVNYFADAFSVAASRGNRILLSVPQTMVYGQDDVIRIYLGDVGGATADDLVLEHRVYPAGSRGGGVGIGRYGYGGWGFSGDLGVGWGSNYGYGQWGFDCEMLTWESDPLVTGTYPYKVTVVDPAGNETDIAASTIALDTFARPASDLTVESYDYATDALVLSFTESEDVT